MGGKQSRANREPPPKRYGPGASNSVLDYHVIACQITLNAVQTSFCCPSVDVSMDCDEMYDMLGDQCKKKGYRLLHFTRAPADMHVVRGYKERKVTFQAYFKKNPTDVEVLDGYPIRWHLKIARSWVQSVIDDIGGAFGEYKRVLHTTNLVNTIASQTQNGERLIAACVTGNRLAQTSGITRSGLGPRLGVDLFFEVPRPVHSETYIYNLVLVPVDVKFSSRRRDVYFPKIPHDWTATFKHHLNQGWRLVDIDIDIPMIEQLTTIYKHRYRWHCKNTKTTAVWIFEKPKSRQQDPTPFFEGTIVEQLIPVKNVNRGSDSGVYSDHNSMPHVCNMGGRGWELATVVVCHSFQSESITCV